MGHNNLFTFVGFFILLAACAIAPEVPGLSMITLDKPVHFLAPDGSDVALHSDADPSDSKKLDA